jgi:hypothetical protein
VGATTHIPHRNTRALDQGANERCGRKTEDITMTTRTVRADHAGPARIRTNLSTLDLTVIAEPGRTHAELTISTHDDTGPSADAVNNAVLTVNGTTIEARMTQRGAGATTIIQTGRGGGFSSINVGGGIVVAGNGTIVVNGHLVSGGGSGTTVIAGGSPIIVTVRVPEGPPVAFSEKTTLSS